MCSSVGSFVHLRMEKLDISLSFQDIFTKIVGHFCLGLLLRLDKVEFYKFFACLFISWLICSFKIGKVGYFTQFSRYLHQNWWASWPWPISKVNSIESILSVCPSVGSSVNLRMKKLDISPSFQDIFTKIGGHLGLEGLLKWNFNFRFVCPSVGSFLHWKRKKGYFAQLDNWKFLR